MSRPRTGAACDNARSDRRREARAARGATLLRSPDLQKGLLANIPPGRLGEPGNVAGVVAFLASDDAGYMTGSTVFVDGGLLWNYNEQ